MPLPPPDPFRSLARTTRVGAAATSRSQGIARTALNSTSSWRLVSRDDGRTIQGQFEPTGLEHDLGADWKSQRGMGQRHSVLMYAGGEDEVIKFEARVWSHSSADNFWAEKLMRDLKASVAPDPDLGRPHIWDLHIGSHSTTVVVKSVGGIRYDRVRPENGQIRGALFRIELLRYKEYTVDARRSRAESLVLPFLERDSFETIALRGYNDPDAGEALRRRNPALRVPVVGEKLHLPPVQALLARFARTPRAPALQDDTRAETARAAHYELRSAALPAYGLGPQWDGA
jgi:hypothetical protein